ncbi:helix-turn-helix domain-containing protein [Shinella sp.]|uniref:helix-turn-helix domain-containing protein n=1 Tax=Shinella sp. TaxID=1870904 RepID=UPI0039E24125
MAGNNFWGNTIAEIRSEQGISQRVLASRTKVNRSTLRRIESGQTSGSIDFIEKVLAYMGYEIEVVALLGVAERLRRQHEMEEDPSRKAKLAAQMIATMAPRR